MIIYLKDVMLKYQVTTMWNRCLQYKLQENGQDNRLWNNKASLITCL